MITSQIAKFVTPLLPDGHDLVLAETGWPAITNGGAMQSNGANAEASVENLNKFLDNFVCAANKQGLSISALQ